MPPPRATLPPSRSASATPKTAWAASAPGRVEPSGGEVRIGAQGPGRIAEVLVSLNDKVAAGDLMVRLDDDELIGRVNSAAAEAAIRKRDRDNTEVSGKAQERRTAEDGVANAERQLVQAREEADRHLQGASRRLGKRCRPRQGARRREPGKRSARPGAGHPAQAALGR